MDTPVAALYYPHTRVQSQQLLKMGLLLWDFIECIVPRRRPVAGSASRDFAEATELLVRPRIPSDAEKQAVHQRLMQILEEGVPGWIHESVGGRGLPHRYLIYPDKLAHDSWRLLEDLDLARYAADFADYAVPPALGLLMMAMLADECAGTTKTKVTDRSEAYKWLMGVATTEMGGDFFPSLQASHLATSYDRLVTASVRVVDSDRMSVKKLLAMRKREASNSNPDLRLFRKRYLAAVDSQVKRMLAPGVSEADRKELERQFELDMRDDLRLLKEELGIAAREVVLSKEIGVCALAIAGAVVMPSALPAAVATLQSVGVGALLATGVKYRKARNKALRDHAMAWLCAVAE